MIVFAAFADVALQVLLLAHCFGYETLPAPVYGVYMIVAFICRVLDAKDRLEAKS